MVSTLNTSLVARRVRLSPMAMVLALIVSGTATLHAAAATPSPPVDRVLSLLQGFEWRDRPSDLALLGEGVDQVLMEIVANPQWHGVIRFRALASLRFYPTPQVARFLEEMIAQEPAPDLLRRGLAAYVHAFGKNQPSKVAHLAELLLAHEDRHVRIQAANTLRTLPEETLSPGVRQALDGNTFIPATSPEPWVAH